MASRERDIPPPPAMDVDRDEVARITKRLIGNPELMGAYERTVQEAERRGRVSPIQRLVMNEILRERQRQYGMEYAGQPDSIRPETPLMQEFEVNPGRAGRPRPRPLDAFKR